MGRRSKAYSRSQVFDTAVTLIGDGSPVGTVKAPKKGTFYWDSTNTNLYLAEEKGTDNWVLVASGGASSPATSERVDQQVATSDGQVSFTLSSTPADDTKVQMFVNRVSQKNGTHFTVSGTSVTFIPAAAGFEMETNNELGQADEIEFRYFV
jgi:hypothetical protein